VENPVTNTINAGCYVFKSSVIQSIEPDRVISVEREVFPNLVVSHGKVFGFIDDSYWLDIGTPQALLKGSRDLVTGLADSSALTPDLVESAGKEFLIMKGAQVDPSAHIDGGSCVSSGAVVGAGAHISGSIIEAGAQVGADTTIINSFIASGAVVANSVKISASFVTNMEIIQIPD
jgi:mannose-1-phosphate guanylyltransferase